MLHKLLAAGPAFNITALLSAAQHSNQGTAVKTQLPVPFRGSCVSFMVDSSFHVLTLALVITEQEQEPPLTLSPYFSPALQSVARLSDVGRVIAAAVCVAAQRYAAEQPEVAPPRQRGVRTSKGEEGEAEASRRVCVDG